MNQDTISNQNNNQPIRPSLLEETLNILAKDNISKDKKLVLYWAAKYCCDSNILSTNNLAPVDNDMQQLLSKAQNTKTEASSYFLQVGYNTYNEISAEHHQDGVSNSQEKAVVRANTPTGNTTVDTSNSGGYFNIIFVLSLAIISGIVLAVILVIYG